MMGFYVALFVTSIAIIGGIWAYFKEKKTWNNGISTKSGKPWVLFDTDSQGGRGYHSNDPDNYECIWISWSVDK